MQGISKKTGGMRYILAMIDVFFKFSSALPVHSNDAKAITAASEQVLTTAKQRHPKGLQTDNNNEFFKLNFQTLMKRYDIKHFASERKQTAAVIKRSNRIIKIRIWTYLSDRSTVHWV